MAGESTLLNTQIGGENFPITPTSMDGMVIGGTTPAAGSFTTLAASSTVSGAGMTAFVQSVVNAQVLSDEAVFLSPLVGDLISIVAAVTPSDVALTLAEQPPYPRKLNIRIVIGTTTTTAITAGTLTLVGVDQDSNAVTEVISLIENASATVISAHAYAQLTSATVAAYVASGSGTGNTVGIGSSTEFGLPTGQGIVSNLAVTKVTKRTWVFTGNGTAVSNITYAATDDVVSANLDTTARAYAPTTAPTGLIDYVISYNYSLVA